MRIRIDFTLDIPLSSKEALLEATESNSVYDAGGFVNMDVEEYIVDYLEGIGVIGTKVIRRKK